MAAIDQALTNPPTDTWGIKVRILTAMMAVLLTFFSISSHRTHSHAMGLQRDVTSLWSHYQAKRIRDYQLELNRELIEMVAASKVLAQKAKNNYDKQHQIYTAELTELAEKAKAKEVQAQSIQIQALWLDFSVGILEVALVLCSLYFVANRRVFPMFGLVMGTVGVCAAIASCAF